jgi:hypothetical protein
MPSVVFATIPITYDYATDFTGSDGYGWTLPYRGDATRPVTLFAFLNDFLTEVNNLKGSIATINGLAAGAAKNVPVSSGVAWVARMLTQDDISRGAVLGTTGNFTGAMSLAALTATGLANFQNTVTVGSGANGGTLAFDASAFYLRSLAAKTLVLGAAGGTAITIATNQVVTVAAGFVVTAGGLTVTAGTAALQGVTATSLAVSSGATATMPAAVQRISTLVANGGTLSIPIGSGSATFLEIHSATDGNVAWFTSTLYAIVGRAAQGYAIQSLATKDGTAANTFTLAQDGSTAALLFTNTAGHAVNVSHTINLG